MPLDLTTGVPGAGKTLFTVAEVLRELVASTVEIAGQAVPRRLCIAGIPELLLPHEMVDAQPVHVDTFTDPWGEVLRRPGEPPVAFARRSRGDEQGSGKYVACGEDDKGAEPVPMLAENWWLWCRPGDVIVIDECQTVFRPMPAGKRAPAFVRQLEVHRHYGIDFVLITQHPQLIHANVRALIGKHRHVRRLFGRNAALIYEWDHCSPPDRIKTATTRVWPYKGKAFGLYKSAQLHTKHRFSASMPLLLGLVAMVAMPFLWWTAMHRSPAASAVAAPAGAASSAQLGQAAASQAGGGARESVPGDRVPVVWPVYTATQAQADREPYAGRALQYEGGYSVGKVQHAVFGLVIEGRRVASLTLADLSRAGYSWTVLGPCAGVLRYRDVERAVTCARPSEPAPEVAQRPGQAASSSPA